MYKYEVIGLRVEKHVGEVVSGHNCDFEYESSVLDRYVLLLKDVYGWKSELSLFETYGECGSGWCTASWGNYDWKSVENFAGKTHKLKSNFSFEVQERLNLGYEYDCELFYYFDDGGDNYYPSGSASVNIEMFEEVNNRSFGDKRPVHIFYGDSNLCKSHIAALTGKSVLETDSLENGNIPVSIINDIIVIGNKHKISKEEVISNLFGDCEVILVEFKKAI